MGNKVKLGELLSILTDYHANGAYKKLKENVELLDEPDFAVMIRTTNFEQEDFTNNLKYINKHAYSFLAKSKVYPNDIIMNKIANAGSSYLMPDLKVPVSLAMNLFLLRVDAAKANPIYIYLYLRVNEAYVKSFANGSVTKTITKDAVRNLEIELPSRSIQDRIAEQFICINNKITLNRQINQTLEQMAQTLFKSWFVDFDPVVDNALDAGFFEQDLGFSEELLHRVEVRKAVRESDNFKPLSEDIRRLFPDAFEECAESALGLGGWIPTSWTLSNVGAEFDVTMGQSPPGSTYNEIGIGLPFFQGKTDFGFRFPTNRVYCTAPKRMANKNDTLISVRAPVGDINLAAEDCAIGRGIAAARHKSGCISFTYYSMNSLSKYFEVFESEGTVFGSINQKDFKALLFIKYPFELINKFNFFCSEWDKRIDVQSIENIVLTKLRDTLLPKLISGELSLSNLKIDIPEETLI
ncbi:TPA: restriction endonuclease subunit S [Proteus mirabilis]|uniref:restriction endonuclease subunit S n=1 Tax=Proteus mirabilis TaxID=584 RepID=UPI0018C58562|nr:restriction endonuclease subunit S [Proteus mirabilis]MBG2824521.1 restriction endonuclease subunit S [Proteus mirabilis]HCD1075048.1 restriction endonuclease subunit S [Proteus mirabilis]HCD1100877.1 restriction endonuclease subunit S [Proteus mirabilis]HCD1123045.1 restriction endonuclease subunit S [Proteus mirabilis]